MTTNQPSLGGHRYAYVAAAIIVAAALVSGTIAMVSPTLRTTVTKTETTTMTTTTACSPAANQENPLVTFRIEVEYVGSWNATAIGYSNTTASEAFLKCYFGDGNGWILIQSWNPNGGSTLSLTVQKMDGSSGNLTAIPFGIGQGKSTVAPYGPVTISIIGVP